MKIRIEFDAWDCMEPDAMHFVQYLLNSPPHFGRNKRKAPKIEWEVIKEGRVFRAEGPVLVEKTA